MKNIFTFLSIILFAIIKSQTIADYKYVMVPSEFADFKENRSYGLNVMLERSLRGKKYTVLSETKTNWPSDALTDPCKVLTAEVLNDKSMFRNKVILQFKNCNNNVILEQKGLSMIKEFETGFQDALKQALVKIPVSNPVATTETLSESKPQEVAKAPQETVKEMVSKVESAQKYKNRNQMYQKIQIANDQFILVDGNSSVPFATFRSTAKKDVYRVKLGSGESTIGYYENGNLVIEMPRSNGEFSNEIFSAE